MRSKIFILLAYHGYTFAGIDCTPIKQPSFRNSKLPVEVRVHDLLQTLTLGERISIVMGKNAQAPFLNHKFII